MPVLCILVFVTCRVIVSKPPTNPRSSRAVNYLPYCPLRGKVSLEGQILRDVARHLTSRLEHVLCTCAQVLQAIRVLLAAGQRAIPYSICSLTVTSLGHVLYGIAVNTTCTLCARESHLTWPLGPLQHSHNKHSIVLLYMLVFTMK